MNIVKRIEQYDENNVFFCEPIKNNIMNDGNFIRIIYSTNNIALHKDIIENIKIIEENILKKYNIKNKAPQCKIYEQLKIGIIKLFNDIGNKPNGDFILKIAGIWETTNSYGLTYKFFKSTSIN